MGRIGRVVYLTSSADETIKLGVDLGLKAKPNTVFCLFGDLGAGKTTLIKGIVEGVTGISHAEVNSPTFLYLNQYIPKEQKKSVVYHFDLYRLKGCQEFLSMGFEEYLFAGGVACIEWSERIEEILPTSTIQIHLVAEDLEKRKISILGQ
jgi:tRNA threonylcarbamoyladenosine biosynthesis protein TsaE